MDHAWDRPTPDPFAEAPSRWRGVWSWLPLVVGFVVFEVTANPMLGVALACLRFGEKDVRTAAWLLGRDPNRARGRACAAFHVAWGFAKVGMMSLFATMLAAGLLATIDAAVNLPALGLLTQIQGALLTAISAATGFLLTSLIALAYAFFGRVKVWVSSTNHAAREARRWPPLAEVPPKPEANRTMPIVAMASILAYVVAIFIIQYALPNDAVLVQGITFPAFAVGVVLALWLLLFLAPRISARSPSECWAEAEPA